VALFDVARNIYLVAKDDPTFAAALQTKYDALAEEIATTTDAAFELTSSTVNGQSFSGTRTMTKHQHLRMLGLALKMLSKEAAFSSEGKADLGEYGPV